MSLLSTPHTLSRMANAIRALAMDAVQQANSGHPGMPMGMAEVALALWHGHLKHSPDAPNWVDRDRFVLSNGHGSMLIYALLHLTGYKLPIEQLKNFRQLHSQTPGHPEVGVTPGVETTTGPLGQGFANAVGMALAETLLAAEFNVPDQPDLHIVDHYTYVFLGDGCLMEGLSHEVASLAGTLKLNKLIALYDDNGISIDGEVVDWFADDTPKRFEAYGWQVFPAVDGHDVHAVSAAIEAAKHSDRPSLICCKTVIGQGAPNKAGGHDIHGAPLGATEIAATRAALDWPFAPFEIPKEVYDAWNAEARGRAAQDAWNARFAAYRAQHPEKAAEFERRLKGELPAGWIEHAQACIERFHEKGETLATRKASQQAIASLATVLPEFFGGSADLTGSNLTNWPGAKSIRPTKHGLQAGNYLHYGVREFGMSAMLNGLALHGGYLPFGGTFLTFSDYSRNALRVAALMQVRALFVFTHDSIGLGEDGPTHQPIEHLAALRLIPGLDVWRPADTVETMAAWVQAAERRGPTCLVFSRQNLPFIARDAQQRTDIAKGGYILRDWPQEAEEHLAQQTQVILLATGSEVSLAIAAMADLAQAGIAARVVSMPSTTVFDRQPQKWREHVLPPGVPRVAIEAGVRDFWRKYVGLEGEVIGIDRFGESAPAAVLFEYFGLTVEHVVQAAKRVVDRG